MKAEIDTISQKPLARPKFDTQDHRLAEEVKAKLHMNINLPEEIDPEAWKQPIWAQKPDRR